MNNNKNSSGFTLIELSIVIVIIGLIVAGVVGGQALVEQAKLRQVIAQMNQIKLAVNAYKLEYSALPGDHSRAADYWGQAASCYANTLGSTNTCNGDGSKKLAYMHTPDTSNMEYEPWHFWKHLENAKLIEGNYTGYSNNGLCGTTHMCMQPGINSLAGPIPGTGWVAFSVATFSGKRWQGRATNQNRNIIAFTNPTVSTNNTWFRNAYAFTPKQQFSIDTKIDDGLPFQGSIVEMSGVPSWMSPDCTVANSDEFNNNPPGTSTINTTYDLSFTDLACLMFVDLE